MLVLGKSSADDGTRNETNGERHGDKCLHHGKLGWSCEYHVIAKHAVGYSQILGPR